MKCVFDLCFASMKITLSYKVFEDLKTSFEGWVSGWLPLAVNVKNRGLRDEGQQCKPLDGRVLHRVLYGYIYIYMYIRVCF